MKKYFKLKKEKYTNILHDSNQVTSSKLTILLYTVCKKLKAFSILVQNDRDQTKYIKQKYIIRKPN